MKVIKRDGRVVEFNVQKILNAMKKAFIEIDGYFDETSEKICENIAQSITNLDKPQMNVEEIQDLIEKQLMQSSRKDVAKAYIIYRNDRTRARQQKSELLKEVEEKLFAKNVENQNANVDEHSFGGRMGAALSVTMKDDALNNRMSKMAYINHVNNMIYVHDLDHYSVGDHNCLSIPFDKLLANGFNTRQTDVRPAQSVGTAFQLVAVIFQLQSLQQFGGVSATHLDWTMVPYVKKSFLKHYIAAWLKDRPEFAELDLVNMVFDDYKEIVDGNIVWRNRFDDWVDSHKNEFFAATNTTEDDYHLGNTDLNKKYAQSALYDTIIETKQAVEGMYHNLNTLQSRSGNQLPFTSINYGTCTSPEGRLIIRCLLETSIKGIGKLHKTSIFPCGIFQLMRGVNRKEGDPNYDLFQLAIRSTSLRLYPNYANVDWSGNKGYDRNDPKTYFSTMGCRTANGYDINGFGQLKDGRGNICPVTIILPTIAMMAKESCDANHDDDIPSAFLTLLDAKIHEAKDMLIERFEYICSQPADAAKFMYENGLMEGYDGKDIRSALKHGTLAVGQLGLAEALQILIGCDHTEERGMELAKKIEQLFKDRCAEFKTKYKLNFGVYYTPAENLCYTAMNKFKERYGVIPNVSDREYFTNSIHVPVWKEMTPFEKIDIEAQLTGYSSAGCITYIELNARVKDNPKALETIINYAMDKDVPYFAGNVPNDMCTNCGHTDEIKDACPKCGCTEIRRLRRVTGYLTGDYIEAFNPGKRAETEDRVKHLKG